MISITILIVSVMDKLPSLVSKSSKRTRLNVGDKNENGSISYTGIKKQDHQGGVRGAGAGEKPKG